MDVMITDKQILPLRYRIRCDLKALPAHDPAGTVPAAFPWPTDDAGFLAYSDEEWDAITKALSEAKIIFATAAESLPDPAVLAACQGKLSTRTEALTALVAGAAPVTVDDLAARVATLEAAKGTAL